ncbi:MAG: hypothetical protein A2603_09720 [Bdellovibrionales bacterium RIFOXYD1_FULL_55_31]|nr:MAG: hypothetical protein A2603_09720 [Bdellovibrionales bacterium RIFOXYD1_FULL_55_31]
MKTFLIVLLVSIPSALTTWAAAEQTEYLATKYSGNQRIAKNVPLGDSTALSKLFRKEELECLAKQLTELKACRSFKEEKPQIKTVFIDFWASYEEDSPNATYKKGELRLFVPFHLAKRKSCDPAGKKMIGKAIDAVVSLERKAAESGRAQDKAVQSVEDALEKLNMLAPFADRKTSSDDEKILNTSDESTGSSAPFSSSAGAAGVQ